MAKKKLTIKPKVKSLPKAGNGLNTPIKGTKEQYDRWRDSSDLNLYTNLQHQLEPSWSVIQGNALQNLGIGQDSEFAKNQHRLFNTADSLIRNNPRLEWGTYGDPFADSKGQNSLREQYSSRGGNSPDIRSKGNVIKPSNFWTGSAANHDYIQPVQPIIYQPEEKKSNSISLTPDEFSKHSQVIERNGRKYKVNYTSGGFDGVTSFEQPINIQSAKPYLLQGNNNLEFNPIPYKKGSYFTTNDDEQERDTQGKKGVRYWDKTTGKRLMGNGGDVKYPLITEGGYDIKRAIELGYEPDGDGHLPSRDYETGQYLKAKNYYTTPMSIINDELLGYKQRQDINGNLYSIPRDQQYPDFDLNNPPARTFKNGGKFVKTLSPIKANSKNKFSFLNDGIFDNSHYVDRLEDNLQEQYNIKSREFQQKYYPEDDQPGGHNDYLDAARHGSAAMYMASENPYFPLLSMGYANLAGAAHEIKGLGETISNPRNTWEKTQQTLKEVKSDLYNNFIGSAVGANPLKTLPEKELQLKSLVDRGKLSILQSKEDKKRNDDARIKQYEENQIVTPGKSLESSIYKNGGKVNTDWEIVQDDNEWELV